MATQQQDPIMILTQIENLARSHREHELFYSQAPLTDALALQQLSRTLKALAGHWMISTPQTVEHANPYAGCDDLNVQTAIETMGVLFLEGEGEPAEIARLKRELATMADDHEQTGIWLAEAMQSTWNSALGLLPIAPLADLLGERHRIIAANWQNALLSTLIASSAAPCQRNPRPGRLHAHGDPRGHGSGPPRSTLLVRGSGTHRPRR